MEQFQKVAIDIVLDDDAILPEYKTPGAAGMDLCCAEEVSLEPGQRALVPTGIKIAVPNGFEAQVRPRSGLALKHGIALVNSPGTIDADYRGEIGVIMINLGREVVKLTKGERIAQLVICPVVQAEWKEVAELTETSRGEGGFGSTGT